ncbi:hypothetical protein GCM10010234_43380 [Streptomyces hawaiiensis]|uniref:hypothetical protein n=1 Tax=Streptomyces hawaiiensis TaxID=67305 RepID=UPI0031E4746B
MKVQFKDSCGTNLVFEGAVDPQGATGYTFSGTVKGACPLDRSGESFDNTVRVGHGVGASLDTMRRGSEPGVQRLAQELPPVGGTIDLVVGEVRTWHHEPWIWVDLTAPSQGEG